MAHRPDVHPTVTEREYSAARTKLEELLACEGDKTDDPRVDELMQLIASYEGAMRFVPDWSGEWYQNAA